MKFSETALAAHYGFTEEELQGYEFVKLKGKVKRKEYEDELKIDNEESGKTSQQICCESFGKKKRNRTFYLL